MQTETMPFALTINGAVAFSGLNRSAIYRLVSEGRLSTHKIGRRTLLLADELRGLIESSPPARIRRAA